MKLFKYLLVFIIFIIIIFFTLGYYLDAEDKPVPSDIIVCLGGGGKERIIKAVDLYKNHYSLQNILLLTGDNKSKIRLLKKLDDDRIEYLKNHHYDSIHIAQNKEVKNTKEEILFIKKYLIQHNYNSAIIVSNTPHTRRIKILLSLLKIKGSENLKFYVVGSQENWWNSCCYYENKHSLGFAFRELVKIYYAYITYGVFGIFGLSENFDNNSYILALKKETAKFLITTFK